MAVQARDETPLIFATQTAATAADLDIERFIPDDPSVSFGGIHVVTSGVKTTTE